MPRDESDITNYAKLITKLSKVQAEMPNLLKDSTNPHFRSSYISLHGLLDQVLPILQENGVLFMQLPSQTQAGEAALTTIFTDGIASVESTTPLWSAKEDAQGQGGAITYMRRYALMAALALVAEDEDDDGNSASGAKPKKAAPKKGEPTGNAPEWTI